MDKYEELLSRADRFRDTPMVGELMNAVRELKEREEVVRCGECKYGIESVRCPLNVWCNKHATHFKDNDFCSYGEKR